MRQQTTEQRLEKEAVQAATRCVFLLLVAAGDALAGSNDTAISKSAQQSAARKQIIVSIPDRKLVLIQDGHVLRIYGVAVGASVSPSPTGSFHLVSRVVDPTYYHKGKVIVPGPANPLGNRWMGLSKQGYGIHGTNVPSSIGKAASHGCIRMAKHDVEELFTLIHIGDEVEIVGERDARIAEVLGVRSDTEPVRQAARAASPAVSAVAMAVAAGAL